jgi:hypothetical protein
MPWFLPAARKLAETFPIGPEAAYALLANELQSRRASGQAVLPVDPRGPSGLVGHCYVFGPPNKTRRTTRLTGYYVDGYTGKVEVHLEEIIVHDPDGW